jgi:type I restriction enzyme S subunit
MNDLPPGWALATLKELFRVRYGKALSDRQRSDNLPVPVVGSAGVMTGTTTKLTSETSVVIGRKGNVGSIQLFESGCWPIDTTFYLAISEELDARFVSYLLEAAQLVRLDSSTATPSLRREDLEEVKLRIPPVQEQRRIVASLEDHLSRLDMGRRQTKRARIRMSALRGAFLHRAVTGLMVEDAGQSPEGLLSSISNRRNALVRRSRETAPPKEIPGYELPHTWKLSSLAALSYSSGYGTSAKCDYSGAGVPVLRIPNVQDGEIYLDDVKYAVDPGLDLSSLYLSKNDLLFVRTNGSRDLIGRAAVVREEMNRAFASYLIRYRPVPDGVEPDWIRVVVSSPLWRSHLEASAASSAGQYNLSTRVLGPLPIPVPPLDTQREILAELDRYMTALARLESVCTRADQRAQHLRQSLLTSAVAGTLVAQDPSEEPASALLERIKAGGAAQSKTRRARRTVARTPVDSSQQETLL